MRIMFRVGRITLGMAIALLISGWNKTLAQNSYFQRNLVSDIAGMAEKTDTNLVNPWGIATSPTSPFWVSDNHAGVSTLYDGNGVASALVVTIPPPSGGTPPAAPAPVLIPFTTVPSTNSGSFSGTATLSSLQLYYMISGLTYGNVHSTIFSGGEIRGQVVPHN
jgi:hypothetical protein